jgi:DNA-binding transcriptional LysR family regulator
MDRFHELRVFIAVAEVGGFAKAANALNSSPPAVTRAIAALEERLGVRLFNRTTRAVHLTEPGTRFLEDARRVLGDLETAEQDVRGEARSASGQLSITASVSFGRTLLQCIVADFIEAHPLVSVSMLLFDRVVDLVDEGFDLAVRIAHLPDSALVSTQIGEVGRMLVASPDYLVRRGTPLRPGDLKTHAIIGHTTLLSSGEWRYMDGGRPGRLTLQSRIETNDAHTNIVLAEQGLGITIVLSYMVGDALRSGELVPVLQSYAPPPVPVHLIYAQRRIIAPKVRAFLDFAAPRLRSALAQPAQRKGAKQIAAREHR